MTAADIVIHNNLLILAGLAMVVLAVLAWYRKPYCDQCMHCRRERVAEAQAKREKRHDMEHRGPGGLTDNYSCSDPTCERNPRRK